MKAIVVKNKRLIAEDIPKPVLDKKGALIRVLGCGLCGSDIVKFKHNLVKDGTVLGHEVVGEIAEINVESDLKVGDKVAVAHHYPCFECNFCRHGNYSMCAVFKNSNITPGGFCEYITVDENHLKYTVFKIPDDLSLAEASFTEPVACCVRAVRRADFLKGDKAAVVGLGSIGVLMGQTAKVFGAKVVGLDIREDRLEIAKQHGFDEVINSLSFDEELKADVVFLTSGADATVDLALKCVRNGGKIIVFASVNDDKTAFSNNEIYYRELTVLGSYSPGPEDLKLAFEMIKDKKILVKSLSCVYNLLELEHALKDTLDNRILKAFVRVSE
ncbi:MAG: alcohol dehydrogenase catalytic domain-containing protein [Candidatus Gastranaerophilales bacterium]|nr:alcohol dehydrogenase catalytic domain-containing protein [Candidatus Gastranaerophilales bacterium]